MSYQKQRKVSLIKSFKAAFEGIFHAFNKERNMRIHGVSGLIVLAIAAYFHVRLYDWIILIFLIAMVISLELVNTAIERVVDLVSPEDHPLAKFAKDTAAGAVLVMVIASVVIGLCVFIKYF